MKTNLFFISSPLHFLFSCNLALMHDKEKNIAVFVPSDAKNFSRFTRFMQNGNQIFSGYLSFENDIMKMKMAERWRRMRILRKFIQENHVDRIFTGTDRQIEFQYAMHRARASNALVRGIYLDEGMATYLGHKSMHSIQHKYIDPFFKKLCYGWWYNNPIIIGASKWIEEIYAAFPELVYPLLKSKEVKPLDGSVFALPAFLEFARLFLIGMDISRLARVRCLVLLTNESFYKAPEKHLKHIMEILLRSFDAAEIAIKAHPRSEFAKNYRKLYPKANHLSTQVGLEFMLPYFPTDCLFIGDVSSALFTIKWFNKNSNVISLELDHMPEFLNRTMIDFYQKIGIPLFKKSQLPEIISIV